MVVSRMRTSANHAAASRATVASATTTLPIAAPVLGAKAMLHAAPTGVQASTSAADTNCVGTEPRHSRDPKKMPTGTTTTRTATR
ncbi:hypothetical protein SRABI128_01880 [Microbacterium sp. Bi128]|nr:hypothetical protein SRABI128_01880 [Microbacterium sp. Bi128]